MTHGARPQKVCRINQAAGLWLGLILLVACGSPRRDPTPLPKDEQLARVSRSARAAYDRSDNSQAIRLYAQALERARVLDHAVEIGNAAYNLAVSLIAAGQYERAESLLREAESSLTRAGENLADVLLVRARLARLRGNRDEAECWAEQVLARPESDPTREHTAQVALLRGGMAFDRGDAGGVAAALRAAEPILKPAEDPALRAGLEQLRGQAALLEPAPLRAALSFDRAASLWRQAGHYRDLARALAQAGQAYADAGETALGGERFFRAARSGFAQGNRGTARRWLEEASRLARQSGDAWLQRRIEDFEREQTDDGADRDEQATHDQ
jgi:tetratricopeptide (TPR) repeat protein